MCKGARGEEALHLLPRHALEVELERVADRTDAAVDGGHVDVLAPLQPLDDVDVPLVVLLDARLERADLYGVVRGCEGR